MGACYHVTAHDFMSMSRAMHASSVIPQSGRHAVQVSNIGISLAGGMHHAKSLDLDKANSNFARVHFVTAKN